MGLVNDTNSELSDRGDDYPPGTEDIETQTKSEYPFEDRFRVDRRKLESMILAESGDAAEKFFGKIMEETRTSISYPSRLPNTGPRCKKDPHVRVCGIEEEDVRSAKERVLEVLDTRGSRVSLKIDVSYTDHSHIIGRQGSSIQKVMNETNCHIHFPDSNKASCTEKSNQVSIAGELPNVEFARSKVRGLMPILVNFDMPSSYDALNLEPNSQFNQYIQKQCGVQIQVRPRSRGIPGNISVKGCEFDIGNLKDAVYRIMQQFHRMIVPVNITLEVTPIHHSALRGRNDSNVRAIMGFTRAKIMFPDVQDPKIPLLKKSTVSIHGDLDAVLSARHLLLGSLPVIMSFDIRDDLLPSEDAMDSMAAVFTVCVVARTKPKQSTKTVIVKASEKNVGNVYEMRRQLLNMWEEPIITAHIPPTYMLPPEIQKFLPLYSPMPSKTSPMFLDPRSAHSPLPPNYFIFPATQTPVGPKSVHSPVGLHSPSPGHTPFPTVFDGRTPSPTMNNFTLGDYLYGSQMYSPMDFGVQHTVDRNTQTSCSSSVVSSPNDAQSSPDSLQHSHLNNLKNLECLMQGMTMNGVPESASLTRPVRDRSPINRTISTPSNRTPTADWTEKKFEMGHALRRSPVLPDKARTPTQNWSGLGFSLSSQSPLPSLRGSWGGWPSGGSWGEENFEPKTPLGATYSNIADSGALPQGTLDDIGDVSSLLWRLDLQRYIGLFADLSLELFLTLSEKDLYAIGVSGQSQRTKLLLAINELRQRRTPFRLNAAPGSQRRSPPNSATHC